MAASGNLSIASEVPTLTGPQVHDQKVLETEASIIANNDAEPEFLPVGDPRTKITNIDRHNSTRTVPLKVLNLGLGRTGTNSLRHALFHLGYRDVSHYSSLFENPADISFWLEAFAAKYGPGLRPWSDREWNRLRNDSDHKTDPALWGREQWDQLLGHCMAVSDVPALHFVPELMDAYPEAKIVITQRDPDAWFKSYLTTLYPWHARNTLPQGPFVAIRRWLSNPGWPLYPSTPTELLGEQICRNGPHLEFPEKGLQWYHDHNEMVKRLAKEQGREVLEFDCRQGWEPLCKFLGEEVPQDKPFPRVNESKDFLIISAQLNEMGDRMMWRNLSILVATLAAAGATTYAWWRR